MPRSAAQKLKRKAKRKAAKAVKKAEVVSAVTNAIAGSGKYRPAKLRGRGAYSLGDAVKAVKDVAGYEAKTGVGKAASNIVNGLASTFNIPGAKQLGSAAGWFTKLLGFGDYEVENNTLMGLQNGRTPYTRSGMVTNPAPYFASANVGSDLVFAHREFCFDVTSSIAFTNTELPINPGNPTLFPWLSRLSSMYEEYEFLGLVFEYRSTSAVAVGTTSSAMGAVVMATDYDCYDANYHTKRAIEAAEFSCSGAPYDTFMHPVECDPKRNNSRNYFIVNNITNAAAAPGDWRNSVLGNFSIARVGQQTDNTIIGELWVTYHIKLSRPILESESDSTTFSQHISAIVATSGAITPMANVCNTTPFTVTYNGTTSTDRTVSIVASSQNLVRGEYIVHLVARNVANTAFQWPSVGQITAIGGTQFLNHMINPNTGGLNTWPMTQGTSCAAASYGNPAYATHLCCIIKINALSDGIAMWMPAHATNNAYVDIYIAPWNSNVSKSLPENGKDELENRVDLLTEKLDSLLSKKIIMVDESSSTTVGIDTSKLAALATKFK